VNGREYGGGRDHWDQLLVHRPRLVALARRCGAGDDAEDVAQEALVRAATFDRLDRERAGAFLSAVVARLVVDQHRRASRDHLLSRHARLAARPIDFADEVCDRDEARWAVRIAARRLPPGLRVLLRSRAQGVSWRELAARYGEPAPALEARTRRALLDLRRRIERYRNG
jgi:RNA polymerase sigma factor (sigma-70 family)